MKQLSLILLQGSLMLLVCHCAPQSIRTDSEGVELLPKPDFLLGACPPSRELIGKSYIGEVIQTSRGRLATVLQFHKEGRISKHRVAIPEMTQLKTCSDINHGIGFYCIENSKVEITLYGLDPGMPGYRYFREIYEIQENGIELRGNGRLVYSRTHYKFDVDRTWKMAM